jgi:ribosomal protein S18 acetylase RimI-like enzyme
VEILDLRQFRAHDLEALLEEERQFWLQQLRWDYTGSVDLIKRFVESRSLPGYAAVADSGLIGYCFFVYEDHKGLIGDLFVSRPHRGPVEERLLVHVIETIRGTPGIRRVESQLMTFPSQLLEPVFRAHHFSAHHRLFLHLDLKSAAGASLQPRAQDGIEMVEWQESFFDEAATLITQAYRDHVDSQINDQYRSLGGAMRFLRNIIHYPGCGIFHPGASWAAFPRGRREMCGLILTSVVNRGIGHVTQVCVAPACQSTGLGYELMRRSTEAFRAAGYEGLSLTVTAANLPAVRLYQRMGFQTLQEFSAYVWNSGAV